MVETIGFIISLLSLLYLFTRQNKSIPKRQGHESSLDESKLDDSFKSFLKSMEKERGAPEGDLRIPLPPSPPVKKREVIKRNQSPSKERGALVNAIEEHRLKREREVLRGNSLAKSREEFPRPSHSFTTSSTGERNESRGRSRIESAVHRLNNRRDLLIYQEIMGKPKSLRTDIFLQ